MVFLDENFKHVMSNYKLHTQKGKPEKGINNSRLAFFWHFKVVFGVIPQE